MNANYFKIDKISLMLIWLMTHVKITAYSSLFSSVHCPFHLPLLN